MGEGDAIERTKRILMLVDQYMECPRAASRTALRIALMNEFARDITPTQLLDIARATGLRQHLHGVSPSLARELLSDFVAAVPAAACGNQPAGRDAARLDWMEEMGNSPDGILLHGGATPTGRRGLGLGKIGRTLRQAVDAAMGKEREET